MLLSGLKTWVDTGILYYFVGINGYYTLLIAVGVFEILRRRRIRLPELDAAVLDEEAIPPIAILLPAYNEKDVIVDTIRSLRQLRYPGVEIVVINDGSSDETMAVLHEAFELERSEHVLHQVIETQPVRAVFESPPSADVPLIVIDKENGGKGDALNAGLGAARTPLVCSIDADTLVDRNALLRMSEPFIYSPDEVIAVGGTVRVANGCEVKEGLVTEKHLPDSWLARFQIVEYLRAFILGRMGLNRLGGNFIISGAFSLLSKESVIQVGGYSTGTVGEDMELVLRLQQFARRAERRKRVVQIPEPICYTQVPETFNDLGSQRDRWHRGLAESLWEHRNMCFNPEYGAAGFFVYPTYVLFELLGPVVELFSYLWVLVSLFFGFLNFEFAFLFSLVALFWGGIVSLLSVLVDNWSFRVFRARGKPFQLIFTALVTNIGYQQFTLIYRLRGLIRYLMGDKTWGHLERVGRSSAKNV